MTGSGDLTELRDTVLAELRRLQARVDELHQKVDGMGTAAGLLERLEESERRRRELGDQAAHLLELLGDARRGLALAREAARQAPKPG